MPSATFMVETSVHGVVAAIKPVGWLTDEGQAEVEQQFEVLSERGHKRFVVDMSALHVMDYSSLNVLLSYRRKLTVANGCLVLASPSSSAKRILFSHNLHKLFSICETMEDALDLACRSAPSGIKADNGRTKD